MKKAFEILMILCVGMFVLSCSNSAKSYTDMLKAEKKAINRLIDSEGIVVIKKYPENGFGPNEFVKLDNDVYIHVIDSGNGTRAVAGKTRVFSRFIANRFMLDTTVYSSTRWSNYGPNSNSTSPVVFKYNGVYSAIEPDAGGTSYQSDLEGLFSEGFLTPLEYVGDGAKVKLIVPFKIGSQTDMQSGWAVYFEMIEFKFENPN